MKSKNLSCSKHIFLQTLEDRCLSDRQGRLIICKDTVIIISPPLEENIKVEFEPGEKREKVDMFERLRVTSNLKSKHFQQFYSSPATFQSRSFKNYRYPVC